MGFFDRLLKGPEANSQFEAPSSALLPSKKRVLVVEANDSLKIPFIQAFEKENFDVMSVGNGADGLNTLLTFEPNLILLDLDLPIMNGITMLHSLRAIPAYKFTPVIVISDKGDADTIRQTKTYGNADAFILKSNLSLTEVVEMTRALI